MCHIDDLKDNLGNRLESVPFLDDENDHCDYFEVDTGNSWISNSEDLIYIQLNIWGLINKQGDLINLINKIAGSHKVDVITLQETWITNANVHLINFPRYKHYGLHRKGRKGGGVSVLVNNELTSHEYNSLNVNENHLESCFVEIKLQDKKLLVGSIYRPPNTDDRKFNENMLKILKKKDL